LKNQKSPSGGGVRVNMVKKNVIKMGNNEPDDDNDKNDDDDDDNDDDDKNCNERDQK
jgi:hypothetical protein